MMTQLGLSVRQLYEKDYVLWIDETVKQLQKRDLNNLDWEHLTEEMEALGNEQRHKVDSYVLQLLIHLLFYRYWESEKEWCQKGWEKEIDNFRVHLELLFESRTLYNHFLARVDSLYGKARKAVIQKTKLPSDRFPEQCPFTLEQILDFGFLP